MARETRPTELRSQAEESRFPIYQIPIFAGEISMSQHEANKPDTSASVHHDHYAKGGMTVKDPVCGMNVDPATAVHRHEHGGQLYFFCGRRCLEKFRADPFAYLVQSLPTAPSNEHNHHQSLSRTNRARIYTCPMHPEIRQQEPSSCPRCGMALEPWTSATLPARTQYI